MTPEQQNELARVVSLALAIRIDIEEEKHPVIGMLVMKARERAVEAIHDLVGLDMLAADAAQKAFALQLEIRRYVEMVEWLKEAVNAGLEAETRLTPEDRETLEEVLGLSAEPEDV